MPINQKPDIHELVICANVFVRKDGKYLLLKRTALKKYAPNVVHPIGGKLNLNENPYVGAQRELLEEAGIKVHNMRLEAVLLEIVPHKDMRNNWLIFHFSADYLSGEVKETEEGEFVYLTPSETKKMKLFPSVREIIHHIFIPSDGTVFATFSYNPDGTVNHATKIINICPA